MGTLEDFIIKSKRKSQDLSSEIFSFVNEIADIPSSDCVFNQYADRKIPYNNLSQYLQYQKNNKSIILLIGEAAGYRGCRMSGIPFTSGECILNRPTLNQLRIYLQYDSIAHFKEASSNAFYEFFGQNPEMFSKILMWNAFPFHPHKTGDQLSNRTPNGAELKIGMEFVKNLVSIMGIKNIVPVGLRAEKLCKSLSDHEILPTIRHPSFGGKKEFISGMEKLVLGLKKEF